MELKMCKVCGKEFDPAQPLDDPAMQAGAFMAAEMWNDGGQLCPQCLANRGLLGMMYCQEFYS